MDREKSLHHLLPQHIIVEEILPRLPVKSLSRFRCVSKSWASLIDSKRFIKTHLQNSSRNHRLILNCRGRIRIKQSSSLQSRLDGSIDPTPIDDPNINRLKVLSLVGCFNGLVCILYNSRSFMFWNPSTRNFKELPQAHDEAGCDLFILNHGFGWDESSDDYKVFASVHIVHMHMHISEKVMGKVYSWKTDSWKTVEHMDLPPVYKEGMFVGGKLHWRRYKGERNIVCFDLNTEVWGKIELPYNCNEEESGVHGMVGVIGGYLSSVKEYKRTTAEVWVMKEYGWSKLIALSHVQELVQRPLQGQAIYAAVGGDGDILLFFGRFFLVYNPQHNEFRTRGQLFDNSFYQETICVESLVWPQVW